MSYDLWLPRETCVSEEEAKSLACRSILLFCSPLPSIAITVKVTNAKRNPPKRCTESGYVVNSHLLLVLLLFPASPSYLRSRLPPSRSLPGPTPKSRKEKALEKKKNARLKRFEQKIAKGKYLAVERALVIGVSISNATARFCDICHAGLWKSRKQQEEEKGRSVCRSHAP